MDTYNILPFDFIRVKTQLREWYVKVEDVTAKHIICAGGLVFDRYTGQATGYHGAWYNTPRIVTK